MRLQLQFYQFNNLNRLTSIIIREEKSSFRNKISLIILRRYNMKHLYV